MGSTLSVVYVWWTGPSKVGSETFAEDGDLGPNADVPDPTTGLTLRHRTAMVRTWALVAPDLETHGKNFFIELFKEQPEIQTRFKGFANKTEEELRASRRFGAHGSTVMHAITTMVNNLDDIPTLVDLLKTTGANHRNRGVPRKDFDTLTPIMVRFLKKSLGSAWSPVAEEAWTKGMNIIISVIFSTYDNPQDS